MISAECPNILRMHATVCNIVPYHTVRTAQLPEYCGIDVKKSTRLFDGLALSGPFYSIERPSQG